MTYPLRFLTPVLAIALTGAAPAAMAQSAATDLPPLSLSQQTSLRCASAFAVIAALQQNGGANEFQPLEKRGREYFVRTMAQLMEETGASRAQIQRLLETEVRQMEDPAFLQQIMPPCLSLLDASGL